MKLPASNISTESSGMLLEEAFGVGNIGLIFEILRNKMYKNPVVAIAREITCNARDAHREVKNPTRPIEVHLPTAFAPQYKVKDYGPGISPERMSKVFIQYATSTKRDDNFQTGGFGLGAKTPFSYADTFSIVTVVDGIKRTYNAYIDETRVGKMALALEQPTDEPNGTTIIIPVAKKDFKEFIDATVSVTEYWDVRPVLIGINPAPQYQNSKILYTGTNWSLYSRQKVDNYGYNNYSYSSHNGYQSNSFAIIDGIAYKIEADSIAQLSSFHKNLLTNPFHFHFGNGELSLSASRDSIHYDEKTQRILVQRVALLSKEVIQIINKKIEGSPSYKDACALYRQTLQEFNNPSQLEAELKTTKMWQGYRLILEPKTDDIGKWAKVTTYARKSNGKIKAEYDYYNKIHLYDANIKLFHNDKRQEDVPRKVVDYYFSVNPTVQKVQVVSTPKEPEAAEYQSLLKQGKAPTVAYDLPLLMVMGAELFSSIVVPKIIKPRKPRAKNKTTISAYSLSTINNKLTCNVIEVDNTEGVYIKVDYKEKIYSSADSDGNLMSLSPGVKIDLIKDFLGKNVYGFTETRLVKLNKNWVPLQTAITNRIKELEAEISVAEIVETCASSNWLFQYVYDDLSEIKKFSKDIKSKDSLLLQYIQESQKIEESINKYRGFIYVLQLTKDIEGPVYDKYRRKTVADNTKLYKLQNSLNARYPLLSMLENRYQDDELQRIIEYVNLIDERHAALSNVTTQLKRTA